MTPGRLRRFKKRTGSIKAVGATVSSRGANPPRAEASPPPRGASSPLLYMPTGTLAGPGCMPLVLPGPQSLVLPLLWPMPWPMPPARHGPRRRPPGKKGQSVAQGEAAPRGARQERLTRRLTAPVRTRHVHHPHTGAPPLQLESTVSGGGPPLRWRGHHGRRTPGKPRFETVAVKPTSKFR